MATFTISLSGSAVVNGSKSWTIADSDVQSLSDFLVATYKGPGLVTLTPAQALGVWAQTFVTGAVNNVQQYQRTQSAVAPIVFT